MPASWNRNRLTEKLGIGAIARAGAALLLIGVAVSHLGQGGVKIPMSNSVSYRTVKIDGLSIFYREAGPKDGPTIPLLHGLPSSSRMFEPLFARRSDRLSPCRSRLPGLRA